jgi:hypothetical protein
MADIKAMMPAEYEFMRDQGIGAVRQSMNVGGGGSNITRGATKFAEDYASQAYQTALNNYMQQQGQGFNQTQTQRSNIYNTLQGIATMGQQGAAGLSNLGTGTATNIANLGVQGATALGAGQIGSANAWLQAQINSGVVKILAEPNIMAISGQDGEFLAGGIVFLPIPQSTGTGGTTVAIEFDAPQEKVFAIMNSLQVIDISNNLGDSKSLITHPASTTHRRLSAEVQAEMGITPSTVRLSVGLESVADLIRDLENACDSL